MSAIGILKEVMFEQLRILFEVTLLKLNIRYFVTFHYGLIVNVLFNSCIVRRIVSPDQLNGLMYRQHSISKLRVGFIKILINDQILKLFITPLI